MSKKIADRQYRPMKIVHGFEYDVHAPMETALAQIQEQIDRLKNMGYGGVVLNVSFHDYLRSVKKSGDEVYVEAYEKYAAKYIIR